MSPEAKPTAGEPAIWQDVEFGSYVGDLEVWTDLIKESGTQVLELGAGSGRVSITLARGGANVVAVERDRDLAEELARRADADGLAITVVTGDMTELASLDLGPAPQLAIAPLHVIQQIDPSNRHALLTALAGVLADGGEFAATVVDESSFLSEGIAETEPDGPGYEPLHAPDMRDTDGWVYSSEPLWVQVDDDKLRVRRLRQRVSPDGEMERSVHDELLYRLSPEKLELDASQAGFEPVGRRAIRSGPREADSIGVVVRK
jgi:SAM-dependent methyltransferase